MRFFPAYTLGLVFEMPIRAFFVINKQISGLLKEEEARALVIYHHGDPGRRVQEISSELNAKRKVYIRAESSLSIIQRGEAARAASAEVRAEIEATRERQKQVVEEQKKDPWAWAAKTQREVMERLQKEGKIPSPTSTNE